MKNKNKLLEKEVTIIDLNHFVKFKENNKLEVKEAKGGLPNNIWETYSAFANSYGGTILLGVGEDKNKKLYTCGLNEIQANALLKSFWDTINNQSKVSINLLSEKDVQIHKIKDDYIVVIYIHQVDKSLKPVYINNNPYFAYRRNHEGDYHCTKLEVQAMLRDKDEYPNDSQIIEDMDLSVINKDTLKKYRTNYNQHHKEDHPFVKEDDENFLLHIGAAKRDKSGLIHPTKAGLLMFGNFYDITNIYPNYFLDYQDHRNLEGDDMRWSFRITSTNGDWSGNLYDFYYRITFKLTEDIAVPFKMNGMFRDDSSPIKKAIREALCNTLSNADYYGELGLVIKQYHDKIIFSNPGTLAMPLKQIMLGGESRARNRTILNLFSFVNIGERAGSGYPLILNATKEGSYPDPELSDSFNPDVTKLTIFIKKSNSQDHTLSIEDEILGIENKILGNKDEILGIEDEILGNKDEILGNKDEILGNKDEILGIKDEILGNKDEILGNKDEILIPSLIDDLKIKQDLKDNLKILYNYFKNEVFGNIYIQEQLEVNKNTATRYIKILIDNNLIEPVTGHGKGKYKFK